MATSFVRQPYTNRAAGHACARRAGDVDRRQQAATSRPQPSHDFVHQFNDAAAGRNVNGRRRANSAARHGRIGIGQMELCLPSLVGKRRRRV
jgi:hypothetical protein